MRLPLAALLGLTLVAPLSAQAPPSAGYPPIGRLVDIGGRRLHLYCTGSGSPTVVFEAGGGAYAIDWALVQSRIDSTTRACSYDRAGLGWSEPGPADETVEQTVSDLHLLLKAAGEKPPFLLVGASIGGIFIRGYQHAYPDEVAGLVFSNTAHHVGKILPGVNGMLWELTEDAIRSAYPLPASFGKGAPPMPPRDPFTRLPAELQPIRFWLDTRNWERWDPTKATPAADLSWRKEFLREFEERCSGGARPLANLPVIVVSSDPKPDAPALCRRDDAGIGLDLLSANSRYLVAAGSGHEIHLYQPGEVIGAIARGVTAIRTHTPLSRVPERP